MNVCYIMSGTFHYGITNAYCKGRSKHKRQGEDQTEGRTHVLFQVTLQSNVFVMVF